MSFAVEMTGISKRFGSVHALEAVDFHAEVGTISALVGENGAGKTTLMKILYGTLKADGGQIAAATKNIGMVSQHSAILPDLTCLENLILGAEGGPFIDGKKTLERADALAAQMGFRFDWNQEASTLSPGSAQKLEILKLLWRNSEIMILDEPTAMLSPADGEALFQSLRALAKQGATIILVTHRLPEVFDHCSRVTVLRGGRKVAEKAVSETNQRELAELIVGKALEPPKECHTQPGAPVLEIENLSLQGERAVKNLSLTLREGEVVGIAGVDGSGQRELIHALIGELSVQSGTIRLIGEDVTFASASKRIEKGLRLIPEDRHAEGLIEEWPLEENAALGLQRLSPFARGSRINLQARAEQAKQILERFDTKHGGLKNPAASLSGGNQQRFVAARALQIDPKLILAFQPARGLDLAATQRVYEGIRDACANGAAALIVSFDLDELLEHCDRVLAMNRGELFAPAAGQERDRDAIGRLMVAAT